MTAAARVYGEITGDEKYRGIHWIANVLLTCGKPARRMSALRKLVDKGHEIGVASFKMPYDCILLDGRAVQTMPLLDEGKEIMYVERG